MRTRTNTTSLFLAATLAIIGHAAAAQGTGGLVNRALAPLAVADGSLPGWFYYGVNAADRGLGYDGSYMTLGGFIPYAEDDLGGLWAADVRGHLSEYGGFFSNVGAVRKQFIGGTLLGVGVYWDYDGDLDQYPVAGDPAAVYGQFGHVYHQVGISGEWLTDYGNLRSNGYIPLGTTAYTLGGPGDPFSGNYILCQYGLDSALGGADLEVGAYVPGLADWAGMISVGGYALGNTRYDWSRGVDVGQPVVPWFGGVYTRLDMTFAENWDFSLQYNNDSYFESTGFARLTYRMGGSRRRNVPDQVEQPMMRNEHVVRAHQTPIVALNPVTSDPWKVIHVDNAALVSGNGTADSPVRTLAEAQSLATDPYDVVFVHTGVSGTTPYDAAWQFQADDQILVGEGSTLVLATANCGAEQFFAGTGRPVLTSAGTAITLRNGAIVDHLRIEDAPVGILGDATLTGGANVNDVEIVGTAGEGQLGVALVGVPSGQVNLYNMTVQNNDVGLAVIGGAADIRFQGLIDATRTTGPSVLIDGTTGGTIDINRTLETLQTSVASNDTLAQPTFATIDRNSTAAAPIAVIDTSATTVNIGQAQISSPASVALLFSGNAGSTIATWNVQVSQSGSEGILMSANTGSMITMNAVEISAPGATGVTLDANASSMITFNDLLVTDSAAQGLLFSANTDSTIAMNRVEISNPGAAGVALNANVTSLITFTNLLVTDSGAQGLLVSGNNGSTIAMNTVEIANAGSTGVTVNGNTTTSVTFTDLLVTDATSRAFLTQANDAASIISIAGASELSSVSNTLAAFTANDAANLQILLVSLESALPNATGKAIVLNGTATGFLTVSESFLVGGSPGADPANVTNTTGVVVTVP